MTRLVKPESGCANAACQEHHLQQVINAARAAATGGTAAQAAAQLSIPTPEVAQSKVRYDDLYQPVFQQPHTYIRFSSTVEDCIGVAYCMSEDDDRWLQDYNGKQRAAAQQCSEDDFEQLMNSFEETTAVRQPFAAVDSTPVLTLDELQLAFDESVSDRARRFAKLVYEYWKGERAASGNRYLMPKLKTLKMDSAGADADDNDPYVCFRRREVRQIRKTRGRDVQVVEKLKKLRKELEDGRQLLHLVKERELGRKDDLALSRQIFDQRASVRDMKRALKIDDPDDDLFTERTPKRRAQDMPPTQQRPGGVANRLPGRPDVATSATTQEADLVNFREVHAQREREVIRNINVNVSSHERWNREFIDRTEEQLRSIFHAADLVVDSDSEEMMPAFVGVKAELMQQPTPPPSTGADSSDEDETSSQELRPEKVPVRLARTSEHQSFQREPHMRRRVGRGGRVMIDRRMPRRFPSADVDERIRDRFKYDRDDGDASSDDDVDVYSKTGLHLRAYWSMRQMANEREAATAATKRAQQAAQQARTGSNAG